jgi:hypothetical protein
LLSERSLGVERRFNKTTSRHPAGKDRHDLPRSLIFSVPGYSIVYPPPPFALGQLSLIYIFRIIDLTVLAIRCQNNYKKDESKPTPFLGRHKQEIEIAYYRT